MAALLHEEERGSGVHAKRGVGIAQPRCTHAMELLVKELAAPQKSVKDN